MLSRNLPRYRSILPIRPLRPPNPPHRLRPFTQNHPHLLVASRLARPQIPYLSQPSFKQPPTLRLLSTESKAFIRALTYQSVRWTIIIFVFMSLGSVASLGWSIQSSESRNPTPSEWRFLARSYLRQARYEKTEFEEQRAPLIDWAKVGSFVKNCL